MSKAVKLADIAKRVGVSTVTVSKALSGQKGVSEELREKIIELAEEMDYKQPSVARREMAAYKSYNIAVLIHEKYFDKYDSFYLRFYQTINSKCIAKGSFSLMEIISGDDEKNLVLPRVIQEKKADGIMILGKFDHSYSDFISKKVTDIPIIYCDASDIKNSVDSVISDSFYGAYYLTNYLFSQGHRQIGFVGTILSTGSITDRYLGYKKSLLEHGVEERKDWIIDDRPMDFGKIFDVHEFEFPAELPTAFVCNSDYTASMVIKKLNSMGYMVPDDISVVGYDNYLYPGLCDVELTTYEVDMNEMAQIAVKLLLQKIAGEDYKTGIRIVDGKLIIRDSVKKLAET